MFKKDRISEIRPELEAIVGPDGVRTGEAEILMYSYDAGMARARPEVVITFSAADQVAPVVKLLAKSGIPFLPRLAGTNLSGGTIPLHGGAVLNMSRLKKIRQIDTGARLALVEPGVVNLELQNALAPFGFFYAPDPGSQKVSTIGGNIGENAGGPLCLKYGVTVDNVEKLEFVSPDGETHTVSYRDAGPDVMSLLVGSEGTLGIVTAAWLKILPLPAHIKTATAAFKSMDEAMNAVTRIIGCGILPRALEAMDKVSLDTVMAGRENPFPPSVEAVLLLELDGDDAVRITKDLDTCHKICAAEGCQNFRMSGDPAEREMLWQARRGVNPAMARLAPDLLVEDGVVPRPLLTAALRETREIAAKYKLTSAMIFHAGDGNMHMHIIFDRRDLQEVRRVKKAGYEMMKAYIKLGGTISGEHGIGVEKRVAMSWLYGPEELEFFRAIKRAFDPAELCNPDKILPIGGDDACGEGRTLPASGLSARASQSPAARGIIDELRVRSGRNIATAVTGLGTRLKRADLGGAQPLDLRALNAAAVIDARNLTARVEAGVRMTDFRRQLAAEGLRLDLPELEGSVGGLIASKAWPDLRDLLLGLEIVTAEGTLVELGGKTVKNVAGYDAVRLMCGSQGAYGVIIAATFALAAGQGQAAAYAKAEPGDFTPGPLQRNLKEQLDPRNLLNPWIYAGTAAAAPGQEAVK